MQASMLAPLEGCSDEQKAGVAIFSGFRHVYRLITAMRFDDPTLIAILAKMRTPGGAKLTAAEWANLDATEPLRWLAIYVALSRVRGLKNLRSVGLNKDIRRIMEAGPPDSLPAQFRKLFQEKEAQTALDAEAAMAALGWA